MLETKSFSKNKFQKQFVCFSLKNFRHGSGLCRKPWSIFQNHVSKSNFSIFPSAWSTGDQDPVESCERFFKNISVYLLFLILCTARSKGSFELSTGPLDDRKFDWTFRPLHWWLKFYRNIDPTGFVNSGRKVCIHFRPAFETVERYNEYFRPPQIKFYFSRNLILQGFLRTDERCSIAFDRREDHL